MILLESSPRVVEAVDEFEGVDNPGVTDVCGLLVNTFEELPGLCDIGDCKRELVTALWKPEFV